MTAHSSLFKIVIVAVAFAAFGAAGALADEPSAAALDSARTIVTASGITRSFDVVVPTLLGELEHNVLVTRPELKDSLHQTLLALVPEFTKTEQDVIAGAARVLASKMTEQELKDIANFFQSPSGQAYVKVEPALFGEIVSLAQAWRQRLSTDILTRAREEMKKKGQDF